MKLILILGAAFLLLFLLERGYRRFWSRDLHVDCLLYTSDAADEL